MKHIVTLGLSIATVGMVSAQSVQFRALRSAVANDAVRTEQNQIPLLGGTASPFIDTVYIETWGNGLAGENGAWTNTFRQSSSGAQGALANDVDAAWEYRGPSTNPNNTIGSRGACYSAPNWSPIVSTTANNGFMIFDSNWLDDQGSTCAGALGTGPAPSPQVSHLESPWIDMSSSAAPTLKFEHKLRAFISSPKVDYRIGSAGQWINAWTATTDVNAQDTGTVFIPMAAAGGADSVQIRFNWDGGYYGWMIDDIVIGTPQAYEIAQADPLYTFEFMNVAAFTSGDTLFGKWYQVPVDVISARDSIFWGAQVTNNGSSAQQVRTVFRIMNGTTMVAGDSVTYNLNPGATTFIRRDFPITPMTTVANYTTEIISFGLGGPDAMNPNDNSFTHNWTINDTIYAMDRITATGGNIDFLFHNNSPSAFSSINLEPFQVVSRFEVFEPADVYFIEVYFRADAGNGRVTTPGTVLEPFIATRSNQTGAFTPIAVGNPFTIPAWNQGEQGKFLRMKLTAPTTLTNGFFYGGIKLDSPPTAPNDPTSKIVVGATSGDRHQGQISLYYLPNGNDDDTGDWFIISGNSVAGIRLGFKDLPLGVATEIGDYGQFFLSQNYPNPADAFTKIEYTLHDASNVTIEVRDIQGRIMETIAPGMQQSGSHEVNVNTTQYASGTYFFTFTAGGKEVTQKFVVMH